MDGYRRRQSRPRKQALPAIARARALLDGSVMSNEVLSETADDRFGSETYPSSDRRTVALASYASSAAFGALGGAVAGVVAGVIAGPEGILAGAFIGSAIGAAA